MMKRRPSCAERGFRETELGPFENPLSLHEPRAQYYNAAIESRKKEQRRQMERVDLGHNRRSNIMRRDCSLIWLQGLIVFRDCRAV